MSAWKMPQLSLLLLLAGIVQMACGGGGGGSNGQGPMGPPVIAYAPPPVFTVGTPIQMLTPVNTGGAAELWSIAPDLPAELAFSASTGRITGTPSAVSAAADYVVTARNAAGAGTTTLSITITPPDGVSRALALPLDAQGWTVFTPSTDSRIMYVAEDGNDSTGVVYGSTSNPDPFNPPSTIHAFATYAGAYANTRADHPDWILYRRGDTFYDAPGSRVRNGRGRSEPFLVGSYGSSGQAPLIKTGADSAVRIVKASPSLPATSAYIAIQGLRFYAHTRNPGDPDFAGYLDGAGDGISITAYNAGNAFKNILVEGCVFSYFSSNLVVQASEGCGASSDVDIRRNLVLHAYSVDSHAQGLYAAGLNRLLVEENVFDHNGWLIQSSGNDRTGGGATFHNHNVYTNWVQNGTYRNNLFMRASSIGTKLQGYTGIEGLVVDNNLYVDGEIGIESCNNFPDHFYRIHRPVVSNNVFYQLGLSNPTSRNVGWGMWLQGWDGGSVHHNLLLGERGQMFIRLGLRSRGIEIFENIGMLKGMESMTIDSPVALYDVTIRDNYFERLDGGSRMITSTGASMDQIRFSKNTYYAPGGSAFHVAPTTLSPGQWVSGFEPDAVFTKRAFPGATRTIETYMTSIGQTGTLDAFIEKCRSQDRYAWDTRFSASSVNSWIRGGFTGD